MKIPSVKARWLIKTIISTFGKASSTCGTLFSLEQRNLNFYRVSSKHLCLNPSTTSLTGCNAVETNVRDSVTFVAQCRIATILRFSTDVNFESHVAGEEAGITVILNQKQHIELSIVCSDDGNGTQLKFSSTSFGRPTAPIPETVTWNALRA